MVHVKSHLSNKPFQCLQCNKGFLNASSLALHQVSSSFHSAEQKFLIKFLENPHGADDGDLSDRRLWERVSRQQPAGGAHDDPSPIDALPVLAVFREVRAELSACATC